VPAAGVDVAYPTRRRAGCVQLRIAPADKLRDGDPARDARFPAGCRHRQEETRFRPAVRLWTRTHAGLRAHATGAIESLRDRRLLEPAFLDRALALHSDVHAAYYGELVWILMVLELWFAAHMPDVRF
jgi:asparagine synthase (glutamine-hydrolysing)